MTFEQLAKKLCQLEGKKQQVNIAQMSEILSCLKKLIKKNPSALVGLVSK